MKTEQIRTSMRDGTPTRIKLLRGLVKHSPFVLKNFKHYFQNLCRREILRTNVVAPYAAVFYTTHKCNLECTYCTQKEPDVFSQELSTELDRKSTRLNSSH